jgi:hypothetical protein
VNAWSSARSPKLKGLVSAILPVYRYAYLLVYDIE